MGAGASADYSGEVSNAKADEFRTALAKLSDERRTKVADTLHYEGDIISASVDELKEALAKLPLEDRRTIADACQEVSGGVPAYVTAFSAKLGVLIDKSSDACDRKPLADMMAWPNAFDFTTKPAFIEDLKTKALLLVQAYQSTLPYGPLAATVAQMAVVQAMSGLETLEGQHKGSVDATNAYLLDFIKERDLDGNGIVSQEEATTIAKAIYEIEEIPADNPLLVASVGKPLEVMAEIITSNTDEFKNSKKKVEAAAQELSEAREKHKAAVEELSLAHYPDLLAKTKDFKAYLDSLTEEQFVQAAAEATESKKNWDAIIAGQGISKFDFIIPEVVTTITTETLVVDENGEKHVEKTVVTTTASGWGEE